MSQMANLFNQYGFYFFLGLLLIDIALATKIFLLRKKYKNIFKSGSSAEAGDMEKVLLDLRKNQALSEGIFEELINRVKNLEEALPKDIRRVGLVRYNPFSDSGGDQSFALALLNDKKDGIVISSLYGREMNRVYAKSIQNGGANYQLTEEEKKAIEDAK